MSYRLIKPVPKYRLSYLSYIEELGDEERYPFPLDFNHSDFPAMLQRIECFEQGIDLPAGYVPSSTYWLVDGSEIVGMANLRHYLNADLAHAGGHIGLSIRPSYRGQKLSIELLKRVLKRAAIKGLKHVSIHCYAENEASTRMIIASGGVLASTGIEKNLEILRYIINLP